MCNIDDKGDVLDNLSPNLSLQFSVNGVYFTSPTTSGSVMTQVCFYHHVCNIAEGEVLDNLSPQPSTTACFSTSLFMNFASYDARLYYHGITRMFFDVILVATDFKLLYCVYFNLYYKCISSSL